MARVEEIEIEADTIANENVTIRRLAVPGVADAGRVTDRREAIDSISTIAVSADSVVTTVDRANVLERNVLCVREIEPVVVGMCAGQIADNEISTLAVH